MTRFEIVAVFIREKVRLEPNISRIHTATVSNLVIFHNYPPMKMEDRMFRNIKKKNYTPGNYPEESIQHEPCSYQMCKCAVQNAETGGRIGERVLHNSVNEHRLKVQ